RRRGARASDPKSGKGKQHCPHDEASRGSNKNPPPRPLSASTPPVSTLPADHGKNGEKHTAFVGLVLNAYVHHVQPARARGSGARARSLSPLPRIHCSRARAVFRAPSRDACNDAKIADPIVS